MENHRNERVAEALREELSEIIDYELEDPRFDGVQVSDVVLSRDGNRVTAFCLLPSHPGGEDAALEALDRASHYIRDLVMGRLSLHRMPELRFQADPAQPIQARSRSLLRRVRKGRPRDSAPGSSSTEENLLK